MHAGHAEPVRASATATDWMRMRQSRRILADSETSVVGGAGARSRGGTGLGVGGVAATALRRAKGVHRIAARRAQAGGMPAAMVAANSSATDTTKQDRRR